ncbi:hypothetical protein WICPIJ_002987 [Wickerhamomyces pijperi]|uniref:TORC1 subunit TCO89 n=1 Tax=Wickerhamomyces pijperi TaxID=599730 RepID=A0A9P8Q817_WICPI|nr:hypothetical protein WICPIJ_002987 [Wickerhamomyces pijperi]
MKKTQSLTQQERGDKEKKPLKQFVSRSHQRSASIGRNLNKLNRATSSEDISSNSRPGLKRSKSSDGINHSANGRRSRSFTKLTSLTSLQPLTRTRSHQLMPSVKRSTSSHKVVLDLRNGDEDDSSDEENGNERRARSNTTNGLEDYVSEEEVEEFTDEEDNNNIIAATNVAAAGDQSTGFIARSDDRIDSINSSDFIPQTLNQADTSGFIGLDRVRKSSTVTDNTAQFNEIEKRRNSTKFSKSHAIDSEPLHPTTETDQLEQDIKELNLSSAQTAHDTIDQKAPQASSDIINEHSHQQQHQQQPPPPPSATGSNDYYHDMILSQSTGIVRKFGEPEIKNSLVQLDKLKISKTNGNTNNNNNNNNDNNDDSIQYIHSNDNINQQVRPPANSFASSSNSLRQFTIQPTSQKMSTSSNEGNSLLSFKAVRSANNLSRHQQYANQFPNTSSVQSNNNNNNNNFSSTPTGTNNFNFNQFLKSNDSSSASSSNIETRTQQKLWLQRENSLLDITAVGGADNDINNPLIRREFERISREFLTVKRFSNPLSDAVKRTYVPHSNGKNESRSGSLRNNNNSNSTALSTNDKLQSFKSDQIQAKLKKLWIEGDSLSKKPSPQHLKNAQYGYDNSHHPGASPDYLHHQQQQLPFLGAQQQQQLLLQQQQRQQQQLYQQQQQQPTTRAVDRSGNNSIVQQNGTNKLDLGAIRS